VGKNTLAEAVGRNCKAARFVGFFSNHSLRATAATRLFSADVDERESEQFLNGTSAHIRLFSAIHSFSAVTGMVDLHKR